MERTVSALKDRGIEAIAVSNGAQAREKLLSMLSDGAKIMAASSTTLSEIGISKEINESGRYAALNSEIAKEPDPVKRTQLRRQLPSPDYAIGSVHAVTQGGEILVATASASQIPSYSFTANRVILVVGTQKIVASLVDGIRRIYEHSLPLESRRMREAYGAAGSAVNQILIFEGSRPGRITVIFVKEVLGF